MANREKKSSSRCGACGISAQDRSAVAWLDELEGVLREALAGVQGWREEIVRNSQALLAVRVGPKVLQMQAPARESKKSSKA